jgi:DnaJ like chaperone protein
MIKFRKLIYLAFTLLVLYYIFIVNTWLTLGVIAFIYLSLKVYKLYRKNRLFKTSSSKELFQESELGLFIALVAKVAKADGRVDELEAQLIGMMFDDISNIFPDKEKTREILKAIFNEEKEKEGNTKNIAQALNRLLGRSILKRRQYVGFLIQLASIGTGINPAEDKVLREIAQELNITPHEYTAMLQKFNTMLKNQQQSMTLTQAYEILGVTESDTMTVIKKSYRKLIHKYHPDILESQNKDEAYMEKATLKTQEINQAYEIIKASKK